VGGGGLLLCRPAGCPPALLPLSSAAGGARWSGGRPTRRARAAGAPGCGGPSSCSSGGRWSSSGIVGFLATRGELQQAREGLLSTAVVVIGLVVLSGRGCCG
jgi:hypothetical protein